MSTISRTQRVKLLFYLSFMLLLSSCGFSQVETNGHQDMEAKRKDALSVECSKFYPFKSQLIDLEILEAVEIDILPATDFKQCSKYAHRFENPIGDTAVIGEYQFIVQNNKEKKKYEIDIYKNGKIKTSIKLPVEKPLPEVHEYYIHLFPYKNEVIMYMEDMYTTHYMICKYDLEGKELMRKEIEHTYVTHPEPNTNHYNPYLEFHSLSASQMIFTSHMAFADKFVTRVLDLNTFEISEYDKIAHGLILDEKEEKLVGFVTTNSNYGSEKTSFEITGIDKSVYVFEINKSLDEACDFIMKDSLLYIANYHPISTGSSLHCYDLKSGKLKWTADVLQVNAAHSEYWNKVTLIMYKDKLIMQGDEAYGSYLQIFDSETGKRLAHFGNVFEVKK